MYPEYKLIQIIEVPRNGKSSPYAVRFYGRMEYFEFDFMCKNTLKKFFADHNMQEGDYLIIHDNEHSGDVFIIDAVCIYRTKENGNFLDFKLPGKDWVDLVNNVLEKTEVVDIGLKIQTSNKVNIPKMMYVSKDKVETAENTEDKMEFVENFRNSLPMV